MSQILPRRSFGPRYQQQPSSKQSSLTLKPAEYADKSIVLFEDFLFYLSGVFLTNQEVSTGEQRLIPLDSDVMEEVFSFAVGPGGYSVFLFGRRIKKSDIRVVELSLDRSSKPRGFSCPEPFESHTTMGLFPIHVLTVDFLLTCTLELDNPEHFTFQVWSISQRAMLSKICVNRTEHMDIDYSETGSFVISNAFGVFEYSVQATGLVVLKRSHEFLPLDPEEQRGKVLVSYLANDDIAWLDPATNGISIMTASQVNVNMFQLDTSIVDMTCFQDGLLFFSASNKDVSFYKFSEDHTQLLLVSKISLLQQTSLFQRVQINSKRTLLYCFLENNQVSTMPLSELSGPNVKPGLTLSLTEVMAPTHATGINDVDVCTTKPYMVTCGNDKTIRVWNYQTGLSIFRKTFPEDVYGVSIHPSGHYLLAAFTDKVRILSLVVSDMHILTEYPIRGCRQARFANGGHLFALANGNNITIVDMVTLQTRAVLKGHNGKIRSLSWSNTDFWLTSCGTDGAVYCWSMASLKRENENIVKGCNYSSAVSTTDGLSMYAVGSDKRIKEIVDSQITKEISSDEVITQVQMSYANSFLVTGTQSGHVRIFTMPFMDGEYTEAKVHQGPVARIKIARNDQTVVTVGEDGSMFVLSLSSAMPQHIYSSVDEVLAAKTEFDEKASITRELLAEVEETKAQHEYQLRLKEMNHAETLKLEHSDFERQLESVSEMNQTLVREKGAAKMANNVETSKLLADHQEQIAAQNDRLQEMLSTEFQRYQALSEQISDNEAVQRHGITKRQAQVETEIAKISKEFDSRLSMRQQEIDIIQTDLKRLHAEKDEYRIQFGQDSEAELLQMKQTYEKRILEVANDNLHLRGENGIIKKKLGNVSKDTDDFKGDITRLKLETAKIQEIIDNFEKEAAELKKDIQERDDFIQEKEKKIFELKRSNQELEKFKFVLDNKIKELRRQIEPKENDIATMHGHVRVLGQELETYFSRNEEIALQTSELEASIQVAREQVQKQKLEADLIHKHVTDLKREITFVMDSFQGSHDELRSRVLQVAEKFSIQNTAGHQDPGESEAIEKEWLRQRELLEHAVSGVKKQFGKHTMLSKRDELAAVIENNLKLTELAQVRKEYHQIKTRVSDTLSKQLLK